MPRDPDNVRRSTATAMPHPMRDGESSVAYIMREMQRLRVRLPWQMPGLSYLAPPAIGTARSLAVANPRDWLQALADALRAGITGTPPDRLRTMVGRSGPLAPFSANERGIMQWAWSGNPTPCNTAVWVIRYTRAAGQRAARNVGASASQVRAAGEQAVNASVEPAEAEQREVGRQAIQAAVARTASRQRVLDIITNVAPQNAIPRAAAATVQNIATAGGGILIPTIIILTAAAGAAFLATR